jgi:hypothetical protein
MQTFAQIHIFLLFLGLLNLLKLKCSAHLGERKERQEVCRQVDRPHSTVPAAQTPAPDRSATQKSGKQDPTDEQKA